MLFGTTHFFEYAYYLTYGQRFDASQQYFTYYFASNSWKYPGKTLLDVSKAAVNLLNDGMLPEKDQPYDASKPWLDPPNESVRSKIIRPLTFTTEVITDTGNADWSEGDFSAEDVLAIKAYMAQRHSPALISVTEWGGFIWHVMLVVGWDETGFFLRDSLMVDDTEHSYLYQHYFTHIDYQEVVRLGLSSWAARYQKRVVTPADALRDGLLELRRRLICVFSRQCTGTALDLNGDVPENPALH